MEGEKPTRIESSSSSSSPFKSLSTLDNSGPSSIESHKSSKTASSITSGTSSLESHKTVIQKSLDSEGKSYKKSPKRKDSLKSKSSGSPKTTKTIPKSNSFTLQVTTKQGSPSVNNAPNTKIYVQNSPVCSVITFENGQSNDSNLVIINGSEPVIEQNRYQSVNNEFNTQQKYPKNTNFTQGKETELNNSQSNVDGIGSDGKAETMNNSRNLSSQTSSKDNLSYQNLLRNVSSTPQFKSNSTPDCIMTNNFIRRNTFDGSEPPSPIKNYDDLSDPFVSKIPFDKTYRQILDNPINRLVDKNLLSSDPNLSSKDDSKDNLSNSKRAIKDQQFPSLSDLSFNFTSLAAQKILNGVSINSIDTLVELNMAANERKNNCDVVHTDFGLV